MREIIGNPHFSQVPTAGVKAFREKQLARAAHPCEVMGVRIYTKTGDRGTTGLFSGERVEKTHPRVEAYGTLDEMNSMLGVVIAARPAEAVLSLLSRLQIFVFDLGSDLATVPKAGTSPRVTPSHIAWLETEMDRMTDLVPRLRVFVLPGGTPAAASIHVARTICRRAERAALVASRTEEIPNEALVFLNRLSDFLFVLARYENHLSGVAEPVWDPEASGS